MSETWCNTCHAQTDWDQRDVVGGTIYRCLLCGAEEVICDDIPTLADIERLRDDLHTVTKSRDHYSYEFNRFDHGYWERVEELNDAKKKIERLHELLVERDGDHLSYGQLRERLVTAESLMSRHQSEIERLRSLDWEECCEEQKAAMRSEIDRLRLQHDEARRAARRLYSIVHRMRSSSMNLTDIWPWLEVSDIGNRSEVIP